MGVGTENAAERRQLLHERADALQQRQPQDDGEEVGLSVERSFVGDGHSGCIAGIAEGSFSRSFRRLGLILRNPLFRQALAAHRTGDFAGEAFSTVTGRQMGRAVPGQRPVVLVVEDENLTRMYAMDMVEEAGFEAIAASDADEAIRILESRTDIRAVFTDIQMPGSMDGLRLARVVRKRWPPVALIVTSGQMNVQDTELPVGGRFVRKPYEASQIATTLRQLIV
jgi:CheY-like chemotaxis protein